MTGRPYPGGARLSALGSCITLFAFSVFWQLRLAQVTERVILYQKHRSNSHLLSITVICPNSVDADWFLLIDCDTSGHRLTFKCPLPRSLISLIIEAQTRRIGIWKLWKQFPFIRMSVRILLWLTCTVLLQRSVPCPPLPSLISPSELIISYTSLPFMKRH